VAVKGNIRILIVEDSRTDAVLLIHHLDKQGYEVTSERVETAESFNEALDAKEWDIVISDYVLPSFSGLDALKILRDRKIDIPCIITSGRIDDETAVAAMKAGARDYVMKDNLKRLGPVVERELEEAKVRRKAAEDQKEKMLAQNELVESQQRLSMAMQASGAGVFEYSNGHLPDYFFDDRLVEILGYRMEELPRPDKFIYWLMAQIHPEDLNGVLDVYDKFLTDRENKYSTEFRIKHKSGIWIYVRLIATGNKTTSSKMLINGILLDITESKQVERRILLSNKIMQLYWEVSSVGEYLEKAVQMIREWCSCECVGIRILDEKSNTIPYFAHVGFGEEFLKSENRLSLSNDECACIRVVSNRPESQDKTVLTPGGSFSLNNSLSFISNLEPKEQNRFRGVCVRSGYQTIAVIPLRFHKSVLGAIHITDKNIAALSGKEIETLEAVASIIGQGVFRFQISDNLKRAEEELRHLSRRLVDVQENERRVIARELHDEIGQSLTALKIMVGQAIRLPDNKTKESLIEAEGLVSELLKQVRQLSLDLRPSMLDDLGLLPTLLWHFERFSSQTGIKINFQHKGLGKNLSGEINTTVYRIIQEALTNIVRYAGVTEAAVNINNINGILSIQVEDEGRGFNPDELDAKSSTGLSGMRERVLLLEGKLTLETSPGNGTRILVELPVGENEVSPGEGKVD
jgi:PAS domain S-box-containing protein